VKDLPVTPFHYPIAKIIHRLDGKVSLSLPALIVGSMVPDLEVPFVFLLTGTQDRLVLHSLIGGMTLGVIIAIALTVLFYPRLTSTIFPINRVKVNEKCNFSLTVAFSCLLGVLSHVLLDVANHSYNPVFWPFLNLYQTPSPIVPLLGGEAIASLIVHSAMVVLFVGLFINNRGNFWERLLVE
jgi:membrane-bound metal-dependent hydrolase YbcI (DUF457 family)